MNKTKRKSDRTTDAPAKADVEPMNRGLGAAKVAKQDEFYTQYVDIQKEVEAYLEFDPGTFRGKVVYCNCDDPFESNFFRYFAANFNKLGLKRLISTSYDGSPIAGQGWLFPEYNEGNGQRKKPKALAVILDHVKDENGDGAVNIEDVKLFLKRNKAARIALAGDDHYSGGDFRSTECIAFLKEADIVVTNPPFSLSREYVPLLMQYNKKFLIIGNTNWITYREHFRVIKDNKMWLGCTNFNVGMFFEVPDHWTKFHHIDEGTGKKIARVSTSCWFTNLDHGRRHQKLPLMTMAENLKFSKNMRGKASYDRYENYDAIEVGTYKEIPSDYDGDMGVPVTFLDKFNPEQFEIIGLGISNSGLEVGVRPYKPKHKEYRKEVQKRGAVDGDLYFIKDGVVEVPYARILIRRKK